MTDRKEVLRLESLAVRLSRVVLIRGEISVGDSIHDKTAITQSAKALRQYAADKPVLDALMKEHKAVLGQISMTSMDTLPGLKAAHRDSQAAIEARDKA